MRVSRAGEPAGGGGPPAGTAVVAMGGHAFMQSGEPPTHETHLRNADEICAQLMTLVRRGYHLVITHGNGPQIGEQLLRNELSRGESPSIPMDVLVAATEGILGYYLQQAMLNHLRGEGIRRYVTTFVTQVLVDSDDAAFECPTKPVGPVLTDEQAAQRAAEWDWRIAEDPGRGLRRVVPSPRPLKVVQRSVIRAAVARGDIVIATGGGGIPVVKRPDGTLEGVEAVIDKDLTSGTLATDVGAELLIVLTAVDRVWLRFGEPDAEALDAVTLSQCAGYLTGGHFPAGSMGPKVQAIHDFLVRGGRRGLITDARRLPDALDGAAGTHFVGRI